MAYGLQKATKSKRVRMAVMAKMWKIRLSAGDWRKRVKFLMVVKV